MSQQEGAQAAGSALRRDALGSSEVAGGGGLQYRPAGRELDGVQLGVSGLQGPPNTGTCLQSTQSAVTASSFSVPFRYL